MYVVRCENGDMRRNKMKKWSFTIFIATIGLLLLFQAISAPVQAATFDCNQQTNIPIEECEALVELYNSTDGSNWDNSGGWLINPDPCTWRGITCEGNFVHEIKLVSRRLIGTLPSSMGNFTNLSSLKLNINYLQGSIPPELGQLTNLQILNMGQNDFTGSIPEELGNLENLQELGLYSNQLTGNIPTEIGNLSNLRILRLSWNELSGNIPSELGNLTYLENLQLGPNQLSGVIPSELGNLSNLIYMELLDNHLIGDIPTELGNLENLVGLYLYKNKLSGSIPVEITNLRNLQSLALRDNQLSGPIPPELGELQNLTYLGLRLNQLTGEIPNELTTLKKLTNLLLNNNLLTGFLPQELGYLPDLRILYVSNNNLVGSIPNSFINLGLNDFYFNGTNICEPQTTEYLTWRDTIINFGATGIYCLNIDFDIMPASQNTCINSNGKGVIPIVLYGSSILDISQIDPTSVTLDEASVRMKGKSGNVGSYEDVNFDGYLDLVVQILDEGFYLPGIYDLNLYAITYNGQQIVSTKNVCVSH